MTASVDGWTAPGFEAVAAAFEENFAAGRDLGAAFAAYVDGEPAVDLWGGLAGADGRPWLRDTTAVVFSGTKGVAAVCLLLLVERGKLALDAPVSRYWPEFAACGKSDVLVRHVVSHTAGQPAPRTPIGPEAVLDPLGMAELLASEKPFWAAGEHLCYHAFTYGWLCGELVRRVDGRTIGRFLQEEVSEPLGLDLWIGLPPELEPRVAVLRRTPGDEPPPAVTPGFEQVAHALTEHPPLFSDDPTIWWNRPSFHAAEIAGAGGIATARALARLYGCLARGGELDGHRLVDAASVRLARDELARGPDAVQGWPLAFGLGFALQTELRELGRPDDAFGHCGFGGSAHGCWPSSRVGFSYVTNELRDDMARSDALLAALADCVGEPANAVPERVDADVPPE